MNDVRIYLEGNAYTITYAAIQLSCAYQTNAMINNLCEQAS